MLLLAATLNEFLQFLKIVLWISIPLFLVSTLVVVFIHYRNKRKNGVEEDPAFQLAVDPSYSGGAGVFANRLAAGQEKYWELEKNLEKIKTQYTAMFSAKAGDTADDEPTKKQLEKQISQYELKIAQLQQAIDFLKSNLGKQEDYEKLQGSIAEKELETKRLGAIVEQLHKEIALLTQQNESKNNEIQKLDRLLKSMQESAKQASTDAREMQLSWQQQQEDHKKNHFEENKKLSAQLKELNDQFKTLEEENKLLQEKLLEHKQMAIEEKNNSMAEDASLLNTELEKAKTEIKLLKDQLVNADALEEILGEKKAEIEFLQNQLENKIRTSRQTEQKLIELEQERTNFSKELERAHLDKIQLEKLITDKSDALMRSERMNEEGANEVRLLKQQLLEWQDRLHLIESEQVSTRKKMEEYEAVIKQKQEIISGVYQQLTELMRDTTVEKSKQRYTASLPHLVEEASL